MEQTNTPQQPSRKKAILSLLVLLALTCVVVFILAATGLRSRPHWPSSPSGRCCWCWPSA